MPIDTLPVSDKTCDVTRVEMGRLTDHDEWLRNYDVYGWVLPVSSQGKVYAQLVFVRQRNVSVRPIMGTLWLTGYHEITKTSVKPFVIDEACRQQEAEIGLFARVLDLAQDASSSILLDRAVIESAQEE